MKKCIICGSNTKNEEMICINCSHSISPTMKAMQDIQDSPTMKAMRDIQDSPTMKAMRDIQDSPTMRMVRSLENTAAFKAIHEIQNSAASSAIKALEASPSIRGFSRIADQLKYDYGALALSEAYELLIDENPAIEEDDPWGAFSDDVQDRTNHTPSTPLSAEFYLSLIFAFFLYILSQRSAMESEERVLERMYELEQTITTQLNVLQSDDNDYVFSVSDRELHLRAGPSMDHKVIEVLPRNKKVIELERNRDWIKVKFFDYVSNINKVGWVHSRYLLVINSKGEE